MDFWRRTNWKIASMYRVWYALSAVLIISGMSVWYFSGLNMGIDFTGGSLYKFAVGAAGAAPEQSLTAPSGATPAAGRLSQQATQVTSEVRGVLEGLQIQHSAIQVAGGDLLLIRTATNNQDESTKEAANIQRALEEKMGATWGAFTLVGNELVGPVVGDQLKRNAFWALLLGNLLILIFLTIRYEFRVAVACIVALVHDVLIMVGGMAIFQAEVNSEFVAALLTVVGFSVTDSVVIFDRVRENKRLHRSADLETITNASLLQTMHRSINTSLVVLLTLFSLFFLGGATIHPFILALLIGMVAGMYSSIFIAGPLVVSWERWSLRRKGRVVATGRQRLSVAGSAPVANLGGADNSSSVEPTGVTPGEGLSAEQAMRRASSAAQEEKRDERRERRKAKGKAGKKRF